jgi:hypothetical protein
MIGAIADQTGVIVSLYLYITMDFCRISFGSWPVYFDSFASGVSHDETGLFLYTI